MDVYIRGCHIGVMTHDQRLEYTLIFTSSQDAGRLAEDSSSSLPPSLPPSLKRGSNLVLEEAKDINRHPGSDLRRSRGRAGGRKGGRAGRREGKRDETSQNSSRAALKFSRNRR